MDTNTKINFKITPSEQRTIIQRVKENGFDDMATYMKVVALMSSKYQVGSMESSEEASVDVVLDVTQSQIDSMEQKAKECGSDDLIKYIKFIALNAVVTVSVEVRSSGNFDDMLKRIAGKKSK